MRKGFTVLAVLFALLAVADRVAAGVAGRVLADRLQSSGGLTERPEVTLGGVPFLTQALRGSYQRIEVRARAVPAGDLTLSELDAVLSGARVSLADLVAGNVSKVPVDRIDAQVVLSYEDLSRRSGDRGLIVSAAGEQVRVTGSVVVLGRTLTGSALSSVTLQGDEVLVAAQSFEVGNGLANALTTRALGDRFDLRVPVSGLPYGLVVRSVQVQPAGVVVQADATDTVLSTN